MSFAQFGTTGSTTVSARDTARAMSQENVEQVRAIYDAYERGDYEAALRIMDEDIEFVAPDDFSGGGRAYRGLDAVREGVATWLAAWDDYHFELRELCDAGEQVVATGWQTGRGRASGVEVSEEIFSVWTLRSGRVIGQRMFRDKQQALEAVGLSE